MLYVVIGNRPLWTVVVMKDQIVEVDIQWLSGMYTEDSVHHVSDVQYVHVCVD